MRLLGPPTSWLRWHLKTEAQLPAGLAGDLDLIHPHQPHPIAQVMLQGT